MTARGLSRPPNPPELIRVVKVKESLSKKR